MHVDGVTFDEFTANESKIDAVIRCLTVVGEVAGRLTDAALAQLPQFDWRAMKGMRNVLVHDYGGIDLGKVWDVVQNELPQMREELDTFLASFQ